MFGLRDGIIRIGTFTINLFIKNNRRTHAIWKITVTAADIFHYVDDSKLDKKLNIPMNKDRRRERERE